MNRPFGIMLAFLTALCGYAVSASAEESSPVIVKVEKAIERGANATVKGVKIGVAAGERGVKRGAHAAAHGVERGMEATSKGVKRGASATAHAAKTVERKVDASSTSSSAAQQ
ncbi:MAG: hypothetical protein V4528_12740 [Pseudomonadota bacterium]